MIEKSFSNFVNANILAIDELTRRYSEYRRDVVRNYWRELQAAIRERRPAGYACFEEGEPPALGNCACGWSRVFTASGQDIPVDISFSVDSNELEYLYGWPFINYTCWTGIRMNSWPSVTLRNRLTDMANGRTLNTDAPDNPWLFWRSWEPLCAIDLEGLHQRLTGDERRAGQHNIVDQLEFWRLMFEDLIKSLIEQD